MRARVGRQCLAIMTVAALGGIGALALGSGPVSASGSVSPTTNADNGSPGSLRGILEGLTDPNTTVVLPAGSGPYVLTDCISGSINIANTVVIEGNGNTVRQTCPDRVALTDNDLTLRNVTITGGNRTGSAGGLDFGGSTLTIDGVTFTGNTASNDAGAININTSGVTANITNSTFSNNHSGDDGGAIDVNDEPVTLSISGSTFNGNSSNDLGGAIATEEDPVDVTLVNSTVTANTSGDGGALAIVEQPDDNLTLVYDTITNNIVGAALAAAPPEQHPVHPLQPGPTPASLRVNGDFTVFGTVITGPVGGPNCDVADANSVTSHDFNFSDDATCGLTAAHDRATSGNDPGLGALADNGGPTETQLPQTGSPLINFIPVPACGGTIGVSTDQRGVTRPQETGCEEGSVEIAAPTPVVVQPSFTG